MLNGPLGIAVTPNGATAYVTNSLGNTVTPVDLQSTPPRLEQSIKVGSGPAAIAITPDGRTAYVTNFNSNTVTPINLTTSPPTAGQPFRVGAGPWSIAVNAQDSYVTVSNSEATSISVINTRTRAVSTLGLGGRPEAIAVTPNGQVAYVANAKQVTRISLAGAAPAILGSIAIPNGPLGIAIAPNGSVAYTANTDATVTPISLRVSPPTPGVPVPVGALTQPDGIVITPNGRTAYIANASDAVTPINLDTSPVSPETSVQVGSASFGIAAVPDQAPVTRLHVTPSRAGDATVLSARGSTVAVGSIVSYHWVFGDGTSKVTRSPRTTHIYARAGTYTASVTATSSSGTSTLKTFTGQTVSNNGSAGARTSLRVHITSALIMTPASGPPGIAITLRDTTFTNSCRPVYIFFGNRLIGTTTPSGTVINDTRIVIPGDASLGEHLMSLSCSTSLQPVLSTSFEVVATKNHLSEFSVAMPNPKELAHHIGGAAGIGILMLLISRIFTAGFPSEWLDTTYAENRERIQARARRRFPKLFINRETTKSNVRRFFGGSVIFLAFIAGAGLINSFLSRGFGLNRTTLWLFLGQCVGVSIVTLSSQLPIWLGGLRERRHVHLQVLIGGMVIAIVCVASSRALGLSPGYCYGLIAVFHLRPKTDEKDWGRLHAISAVVVLVVSTAAFFLTVPLFHLATEPNPNPLLLIIVPALNVTFLGGFAGLAFGMFPLPFLPGRHVARWNRPAWLAITAIGLIGFVAVLLSPGSGTPAELRHVALIPLISAFVLFGALSLAFMLYFHFHPGAAESEHETTEPDASDVVATIAASSPADDIDDVHGDDLQ